MDTSNNAQLMNNQRNYASSTFKNILTRHVSFRKFVKVRELYVAAIYYQIVRDVRV